MVRELYTTVCMSERYSNRQEATRWPLTVAQGGGRCKAQVLAEVPDWKCPTLMAATNSQHDAVAERPVSTR
jgi:hypothetical protein